MSQGRITVQTLPTEAVFMICRRSSIEKTLHDFQISGLLSHKRQKTLIQRILFDADR
jgi:hypothetical protein